MCVDSWKLASRPRVARKRYSSTTGKGQEPENCSELYPRITSTEEIFELEKYHASAVSRARLFAFELKEGHGRERGKWLSEVLLKGPVFVTDYLSALKPCYVNDKRTVACFDPFGTIRWPWAGSRRRRIWLVCGSHEMVLS